MYAGYTYAGITYAGVDIFKKVAPPPVVRALGIGGSGFPPDWYSLMNVPVRKQRRRSQILALREDTERLMRV